MVISEFLPNPRGQDSRGEFIEIYNPGLVPVDVSGWALKASSAKKPLYIKGVIAPGTYVVLRRPAAKFTLRNRDETLSLYDSVGRLVDQASFAISAPEEKSFSRFGKVFLFTEPTPGAPNRQTAIPLINIDYPLGVPLNQPFTAWQASRLLMAVSLLLTVCIIVILKRNDASHFFLNSDEASGG